MAVNDAVLQRLGGVVHERRAQMTVEFVVAFPALLLVALIAINALLFISECALFDRIFRTAVNTYAVSPAYGQTTEQTCLLIQNELDEAFNREYLEFEVISSGTSGGMVAFEGKLFFAPTLFGKGILTGVFGVSFPELVHHVQFSIDSYKPGVLL